MKKYLDNQYHTKSRRMHIGDCVLVTMTKQDYAPVRYLSLFC